MADPNKDGTPETTAITNSNNISAYVNVEFLKTKLTGVFEKKSSGDETIQRILVTPTEESGNVITVREALGEINNLIEGIGGANNKIDQNALEDKLGPFGIAGEVVSNLQIQLRQAFLYSTSTTKGKEGSEEKTMEYAVNVEINNINSILENLTKGKFSLFNIHSIGLAIWNTNRKKVLERMNMCSIDDLLAE